MKTLISSEYGLTISGHVTVLRQWLSEKNTDYIIMPVIIPHVNFQQSDWSVGRVKILNVTRQCLTAVKFVVEMGHSV